MVCGQAAQMVSTDLALARWADRARVAPQTARSVPMRPPATNAKMDNILPTPIGVITSPGWIQKLYWCHNFGEFTDVFALMTLHQ